MTAAPQPLTIPALASATVPLAGTEQMVVWQGGDMKQVASGAVQPPLTYAGTLTAAGTTRADALALTHSWNALSTVTSGTGVVLNGTSTQFINNAGATGVQVYAPGSITIDGAGGATGVALANTKRCAFYLVSPTQYISAALGAVSS